jgi:hypothetical protein
MNQSLAILVSSHDPYSDLWPPYFAAFHRNWPDCPFPVYLLSNHTVFPDPSIKPILVGDIRSWPDSIRHALNRIDEEFVLLLLEDLFLISPIDTGRFLRLAEWVREHRPACVRVEPVPGMIPSEFKGICKLPPGIIYRASTVLTLWRKEVLLSLLRSEETIWQFEVQGSVRTDVYPDFYATEETYLPWLNGVIRGKWVPRAQAAMIAAGYPVQTQSRELFTLSERIRQFSRYTRARALRLLPLRFQRGIRLWFDSTPHASVVAAKK